MFAPAALAASRTIKEHQTLARTTSPDHVVIQELQDKRYAGHRPGCGAEADEEARELRLSISVAVNASSQTSGTAPF
jgi:hypothetical protein